MGKHQAAAPPNRKPQSRRARRLALGLVAVLALGGGIFAGTRLGSSVGGGQDAAATAAPSTGEPAPSGEVSATPAGGPGGCPDGPVRVVAAAGIADVITASAPDPSCLEVTSDSSAAPAPALVAGEIDVWVPDSRVRAIGAGDAALDAPSVAASPLVMAAEQQTAATVAPQGATSWGALLGAATGEVSIEMPDASESSVGLMLAAPLSEIAEVAAGDRYLGYTLVAATLTAPPLAGAADVDPGIIRVTELRNLAGLEHTTVIPAVEGNPALDYPWLVSPVADPAAAASAEALLTAVLGEAGASARADAGFAEPGTQEVLTSDGTVLGAVIPAPELEQMPLMYALADAGGARGHGLAVADISGSMGLPAAPGSEETRMQVARASAALTVQILADDTELGLWVFGYEIDGDSHYEEVVPRGPMSQNRELFLAALDGYEREWLFDRDYGTALYDTVLAAYRHVHENWAPGSNNVVAVFTDGRDEDAPGGISLAELEAEMVALADPERPIQLALFGYGEADMEALQSIAEATDGFVYSIQTPEQVVGAFIDTIAQSVLRGLQQA